jgi:hypothetical protein
MPDWPTLIGGSSRTQSIPAPSSGNARAFATGTQHVKSAWIELSPSLPFECAGLLFTVIAIGSGSSPRVLFDLGLGAAGSEQPIVANVPIVFVADRVYASIFFPIALPAGQRLVIRGQTANAGGSFDLYYHLELYAKIGDGPPGYGSSATYGAITASSDVETLSGGAPGFVAGSWVQYSSAARPARAAMVFASLVSATNANYEAIVELGIGASGSEQVLGSGFHFLSQAANNIFCSQVVGPVPLAIPGGQRLVARLRSGPTTTGTKVAVVTFN